MLSLFFLSVSFFSAPPRVDFYQVQSGDTLYGLARAHHCRVGDFYKENPWLSHGVLRVGEWLKIPPKTHPSKHAVSRPLSRSLSQNFPKNPTIKKKKHPTQKQAISDVWPIDGLSSPESASPSRHASRVFHPQQPPPSDLRFSRCNDKEPNSKKLLSYGVLRFNGYPLSDDVHDHGESGAAKNVPPLSPFWAEAGCLWSTAAGKVVYIGKIVGLGSLLVFSPQKGHHLAILGDRLENLFSLQIQPGGLLGKFVSPHVKVAYYIDGVPQFPDSGGRGLFSSPEPFF